jgi:hypothetical protein
MSRAARVRTVAAALLTVATLAAVSVPASATVHAQERPSPHAFDPLDLPDVERIRAKAAAGEHPRFSWPAVDGATDYTLVVQNLKGRPYWAWRGPETTVYLGGTVEPSTDVSGPVLRKPAQWQVIAYASDGTIVGASPWRVVRAR